MKTITIIDDCSPQVNFLEVLIKSIHAEPLRINKIYSLDDIDLILKESLSSNIIFCDLHFINQKITGENILDELFMLGFKGKAFILSGDIIATDKKHQKPYNYLSKLSFFNKEDIKNILIEAGVYIER